MALPTTAASSPSVAPRAPRTGLKTDSSFRRLAGPTPGTSSSSERIVRLVDPPRQPSVLDEAGRARLPEDQPGRPQAGERLRGILDDLSAARGRGTGGRPGGEAAGAPWDLDCSTSRTFSTSVWKVPIGPRVCSPE
jgi:hypothetical protein